MQLAKMKELRQDKGLTQEDLGGRCGVSRQLIGLVETGVTQAYPSLQKRIARALGVQTADIWGVSLSLQERIAEALGVAVEDIWGADES